MDEKEKAVEYLRAKQEAAALQQVLDAAKARYDPIVGALFPERRQAAEEASWGVMDRRDEAERRAEQAGSQLSAQTKKIADEVFEDWKKGKR